MRQWHGEARVLGKRAATRLPLPAAVHLLLPCAVVACNASTPILVNWLLVDTPPTPQLIQGVQSRSSKCSLKNIDNPCFK